MSPIPKQSKMAAGFPVPRLPSHTAGVGAGFSLPQPWEIDFKFIF